MPQIPTIQRDSTLLGRSARQPEADASAFGSMTGDALQRLGATGMQATAQFHQISEVRKSLESDKWANEAMSELRQFYGPWMANNENNSKETFADDFKNLTDQSLKDWEAKAPTKEARIKFRDQFQRYRDSRLEAASATAAKTQMDNMLLSHESLNGSIIQGYMSDRATPNVDANKELMSNIADRFASIDQSLGKLAPAKAAQLKGQLIEDATYTTMNYSTTTARKILELGTGFLDGRRIHAIESQIKTAEESITATDRSTLTRIADNMITAAQFGNKQDDLSEDLVSLYLPASQVKPYVAEVNAKIHAFNKATDHVNKIKSWNPQAKKQYVSELKEKVGTNVDTATEDAITYKETLRQVDEQIDFAEKDPAGALIKFNPAANALAKQIDEMKKLDEDNEAKEPNPMIKQKQGELSTLLLSLQSQPPSDYSEDQKKQHNIVNRAELMVMSKTQAEAHVNAINKSSPEEAVDAIKSVVANHPGNEDIAFNNLVQNGLDLAYWALYKNQDNQNIADLAGAIRYMKELKETNPDRLNEIDKMLNPGGTPRWDAFLQLFPNDNYQRQDITAGMRRAVVAYAISLMQDGKMSPELAVQKSVDTWLYKEMALVAVNGQPVLLDRRQGDKPPMDDNQAEQFARNLGELQNMIDPRKIDGLKYHFPSIWGPNGLGTEEEKWNQTKSAISSRGFFKPAGEYSTLYMRSDTGRPFELRRNGKALAVKNTDVPEFVRMVTWQDEYGVEYSSQVRDVPENKDIFEKGKKTVPTTGLSARDKGFTGMANLFNPKSPHNLINRIYGEGGLGATGKSYVEETTPTIISTNWPIEPKYLQLR